MTGDFGTSVVVITGGASGIGRSLAFAFAKSGARIVVADLRPDAAERVAESLRSGGREAIAVGCDIIEERQVEQLVAKTIGHFGACNVLCNVAGVTRIEKLDETSAPDIEWLFSVNVFGLCHTVRHFVPELRRAAERGEASHIINASSGFGVAMPSMGPVLPSAYAGTKHAIVGLSDALREELRPDGIGVSVFCPGLVNTQTWTSMSFRQDRFGGPVHGSPESRATVETYGQDPDETADLILAGVRRGDFFILPLDAAARKSMLAAIERRYEELLKAVR